MARAQPGPLEEQSAQAAAAAAIATGHPAALLEPITPDTQQPPTLNFNAAARNNP